MTKHRWHPELIFLIGAAFATRTWMLFQPNAVVFDEVYFKAFAAHYLDGHYFFDIHPPLSKLLIAGLGHLLGLQPAAMLSGSAVGLRLLPALAGALLVPVVWGILRKLGASRPFALLGASMVLFDNALLVESRFILTDSLLLLFGLGAIFFYLSARTMKESKNLMALSAAGLLAGCALSTKWTGLNALGIILLLWLYDQYKSHSMWRTRIKGAFCIIVIPLVVYISSFWLHFQLLPTSGDGDAFMSPKFQQTLGGNINYNSATHLSFFDKFIELNQEMYQANKTLTASHPYGSHWYTWPIEQRPIYYWQGPLLSNNNQGNIYLLGNPIVWWGTLTALLVGFIHLISNKTQLSPKTKRILLFILVAYLINLLPFVGVTRVMFLYHYFFAFCYSIFAVIILWNDIIQNHSLQLRENKKFVITLGGLFAAIIIGFIFFAPLSYGLPLSSSELQTRIWLPSWR